jgi:hypothetical protein
MKRILHLLPAVLLVIASCEQEPFADFIVSSGRVEVFETVYFTNTSSHSADHFEWDFGDGTWSDGLNTSHYYDQAGVYDVTLKAYRGLRMVDQASVSIEVMTTALTVIVEEFYDHYRVSDASVILYPTLSDWDYETNAIVEGVTDENGLVRFENLNPVIYYVDVWHPDHNNYQLADDDVNWIMTDQLIRDGETEFIAYVDRITTVGRADGKDVTKYRLLRLEPRVKETVK